MYIFKEYIKHLNDNPKGYWFKRKLYGWGWTPAKWQGWLVILVFIAFIVWSSLSLPEKISLADLNWFFAKLLISASVLMFICYKKGEKPRWQWGNKK